MGNFYFLSKPLQSIHLIKTEIAFNKTEITCRLSMSVYNTQPLPQQKAIRLKQFQPKTLIFMSNVSRKKSSAEFQLNKHTFLNKSICIE